MYFFNMLPHISPSGMQLMQNLCSLGKLRLIIFKTFPQQRQELVHRHQKFTGHHFIRVELYNLHC